jgi:hypothetical protein
VPSATDLVDFELVQDLSLEVVGEEDVLLVSDLQVLHVELVFAFLVVVLLDLLVVILPLIRENLVTGEASYRNDHGFALSYII